MTDCAARSETFTKREVALLGEYIKEGYSLDNAIILLRGNPAAAEALRGVAQAVWHPIDMVPPRGDTAMFLYFPPIVTGAYSQSTLPAMYRTGHPDEYPNRRPSHFMLVGTPSLPSTERTGR